MKKLLTFLLTALLAFGVGWAETATLTMSSQSWSTGNLSSATTNVTIDDVTFSLQKGSANNTPYYDGTYLRFYSNSKLVISCASSITSIQITGGNNSYPVSNFSASVGSYSNGTWTGNANEITFTVSNNRAYVKEIVVTYTSSSAEPNWYRKVMSESDLVAGKKCIFVYENGSSSAAMGALVNGHGTGITGLSITDNKINIGGTNVSEFTLGGTSNAWTFLNSDSRYLGVASTSGDSFSTSATLGSFIDLRWTIGSDGTIRNNQYTTKYIRCNSIPNFGLFSSGNYAYIYVQDLEDCATPTFTPAAGTYTETQDVEISCATSGATIYYTTDGATPTTSSAVYSSAIPVSETTTIKAMAVASGYDNSAVAEATYTINSGTTPTGKTYQKITSTSDLTDGNYLIVYEDESLAFDGRLTSLANTNNNCSVDIVTSGNNTITTSDDIYFTYDSSSGTLKSASGYYIGQTSNANGLASSTTTTYTNTITFSDGDANIVSGGAYLRFNSTSSERRFRYFRSATYTAQKAIQLYKDVTPTTPKVATPTFSPDASVAYTSAQTVTISCATEGATIHYTYNGGPEQTGTSPITLNVNSTATIVAWATLADYEDSETVTATYNINLTPTLTAAPNPLNINDDNTSGGRTGAFTVTGANLPSNVGVDVMSGNFSRTNSGDQAVEWGFNKDNNNGVNGTVTVTYNGNALSESGVIRLASGNVTTNVDVNYLYTGPIYLFGNVGADADHINNFDFSNGVAMTRNTADGTYSVNITAVGENGGSDSWMFFSKSQGDEATAVSTKFGPDSNGPWYLQGQTDYTGQSIPIDAADYGSNAATIHLNPGEYTVQVNPNDNTFTISALVHAPVISLASGTYSGTQEVIITSQTPGATIYYTTDGTTPTTSSSSIANGGTVTISESCTLYAIAVSNGVTSTVTEATYVIVPPFVAKDYEMLTNIDDLVAGQTYLIVYKTGDDETEAKVMGPVNASNIGTVIDATENNGIITSTDAMAVVTLSGQSGYWKLLTNQGALTAKDANNLYYDDSNHTWTISDQDPNGNDLGNKFAIRSNTVTGRYLQYNPSSTRFACYKTNSNQKYVYIYKESSTPAILANPTTVSIELAAGEAQGSNTFTVGGRNLSEGVTLTLSAEDQAKGFSLSTNSISQEAALAGNVEVTVTYNGQGANETASITLSSAGATNVTVTVNATREPLTVTISPASCNFVGSVMSEPVTITANVPGATIEYSLDNGTTWQTYTDGITITIGQVNNSVTVMARATLIAGGNTYTSETVSETYTRQPKSETLYEKVTDESQIKAGEKYVIVYEGATPVAFNGTYSSNNNYFGSGVNVAWRTQNQLVDIANTDAIVFTLGGTKDNWTLEANQRYLESTNDDTGVGFYDNASSGYEWQTPSSGSGYGLTTCNRELRYNTQLADRGPFRLYTNSTGVPAYLYVLRPAVMAPEITPATGEYSEHQDVTITAENGTTIYYTTDGSDPTSSSTPYEGQFTVHYDANNPTTIKAIAVDDEGNVSTIAEVVYTWIAPKVTIRPATRDVYNPTLTVVIGCNPVDATVYYTTDGSEPSTSNGTLYEGPFEVTFASLGDQVTVKAIAYNDDDVPSAIDAATYTYAEKVINVDAPFFSPLEGKDGGYSGIYYGNQTLEIATSTANADIYYVIESVSGTTPPSSVSDPTKSSTHYSGPISMTVGNSYRVKAIAYIGDFASTISEGYYTILPERTSSNVIYVKDCAEFNALTVTGSQYTVQFMNPVQVVYMSTYANNGTMGEFCYVRDNSDYACIYLGKRNTNGEKVFNMGDWIDGNLIKGEPNIWDRNFHIQLQNPESWPTSTLGNSEILPEEITNAVIVAGTAQGSNSWGHYVHLRKTRLRDVKDYADNDPKHTGLINDGTADAYYYDKFYRWSAGTCSYNNHNDVINHVGDYDQDFFTEKQNDGATFDVYGIVDYYKPYAPPFEICPIDFLWIYKPVITPGTNLNCTSEQVIDITVETPDWTGATTPTIYYKTDDMDDWAEFIGPFVVNSDTHVQAYAEMPSRYDDMMRSEVVETEYKFANIKEPIITDDVDDNVIEVTTGNEEVNVTISTNPESPDAVTLYTTNGEVPTLENGTPVENGEVTLDPITETTTVTAISYIEVSDGQGGTTLVWSKPVTQTYTFVKSNGVVYDLVNTVTTDKVYVIVNKDAYMGLSTAQNGSNRGSTGVKFKDDSKTKVYGNDELALFVLESANAGRYYFKNINGNGYLTVTTNDVANLSTSATTSSYSEAEVSIDQANGNPATIRFNYDGTYRYLRYFAKGRTFTTNSDATLNQEVFLYGTESTPLAIIESEKTASSVVQVTVADNLIGAWAVNGNGHKYLWAKDMGLSIDKTAPVAGQKDYVKNILHYQNHDWDQSNWVILDFSGLGEENNPENFVGKKLTGGSITGWYVDDNNYRILLVDAPGSVDEADADAGDYPGYGVADVKEDNPQSYEWGYNTYIPTNFYDAYMNAPYGEGFVAEQGYALGTHAGDKLFFMNPKVQEVARVWGVYTQKDGQDVFTCFEPNLDNMVNGWGLKGAFAVEWDYNRVNPTTYGERPSDLSSSTDMAFMFHAAIVAKPTGGRRADAVGADEAMNMSDRFVIYPLDFASTSSNVVTGVQELKGAMKAVESVRYYNMMGMESKKPFEGINIVVTRYTDGSTSTTKILR